MALPPNFIRPLIRGYSYFGAFQNDIMDKFWTAFEDWEVQSAIEAIKRAGVSLESSTPLHDVPAPVLYHLFSKPGALKYSFVLDVLATHELPQKLQSWPKSPPPGVLLLALHESSDIRQWVGKHWDLLSEFDPAAVVEQHQYAVHILLERLNGKTSDFPFIASNSELWSTMDTVIRWLPRSFLITSGVGKAVISHLHDTDARESLVSLRCLCVEAL